MIKINEHYKKLEDAYLFSTVTKKTNAFKAAHPEKDVIKMAPSRFLIRLRCGFPPVSMTR